MKNDGSNDEPEEDFLANYDAEIGEDDSEDDELIDEPLENTLLEVEGYMYSFDYAESDKLFDEIFKFFPYAQWFLKKEIPDEDKRNIYNFLITFKGVLAKSAFEDFKKLFKDIDSSRYSICYEEIEDNDTPPKDDTNPENDAPNDDSDVEGNAEFVDITEIRKQAYTALETVKAECKSLEKEQDKLPPLQR